MLRVRVATVEDVPLLAEWNRQLIQDEGHRNPMTLPELAERMRGWLNGGEYTAVVFEDDSEPVAYALYRDEPDSIYLRQLFVARERRRRGVGRQAIRLLVGQHLPPSRRLTVSVLVGNAAALEFWRAVGFADYSLTLELPPRSPVGPA